MTVKCTWGEIMKDMDGKTQKHSQNNLYLDITVTGADTEETAASVYDSIVKYLSDESQYTINPVLCPSWEDKRDRFKSEYFDSICIPREYGYITEQKREIMELVKEAKKSL